jgi:hypothetical protein
MNWGFVAARWIGYGKRCEAIGGEVPEKTPLEKRKGGIEEIWDPYISIIPGFIMFFL